MITDLTQKKCEPCEGGVPPLGPADEDQYLKQVPEWQIDRDPPHRIWREFQFAGFPAAIAFVNEVADLAEAEGHHPTIHVFYDKVELELYTHAIGGLSENDFILAAKVDQLLGAA